MINLRKLSSSITFISSKEKQISRDGDYFFQPPDLHLTLG